MAWSVPATAIAGSVLTAAWLNTYLRDNMNELRAGGMAIAGQAAGDILTATSATQLDATDTLPTGVQSNITLTESQITDGTILARVAGNETITGEWTLGNNLILNDNGFFRGNVTNGYRFNNAANTVRILTLLDNGNVEVNNGNLTVGATTPGRINSATAQPGFLAYKSSAQTSVGDGTTVTFDTESFDTAGNFASSIFTAPVTGIYQFCVGMDYSDGASDNVGLDISVSGVRYRVGRQFNSAGAGAVSGSAQVPMGNGETAFVVAVLGVAETIDINGQAGSPRLTWFSGRLMP